MRKIIATALWLLSFSVMAADYNIYCSSTNAAAGNGSIGNPYKALASISWATVGAQVMAGNPVRINLQRGSKFAEALTIATNGRPTAPIYIQSYGAGARPIIDGGAARANCITATSRSNLIVMDLLVTNSTSYSLNWIACRDIQMWRVESLGCWSALYDNATTNLTASSCTFQGTIANQIIRIEGANNGYVFYYCFIGNSPRVNYGVYSLAGLGGSFVNCDFIGIQLTHVYNSASTATIGITNSVFSGTASGATSGDYVGQNTAGTCIFDHCMAMNNGRSITKRLSGIAEYNTVQGEPRYTKTRYPAVLMIGEDDGPTWDDWRLLATQMLARGWNSYLAYSGTHKITPAISNQMNTVVAQGHEIVSHTRYHSSLTDPKAFILQYVGPASTATLTISNNLLTTITNGVPQLSFNVTNYTDQLALVTYLDGLPDYTCSQYATYNHAVPPRFLTNVFGADIRTAYTSFYDYTNLLNDEIILSKSDLETVLSSQGYVVTELVYPGGYYDAGIEQRLVTAGYIGSRGVNPPAASNYLINSNNVYALNAGVSLFSSISSTLLFAGNANDASAAGVNFTASGITWPTATPFRLSPYAYFNGSSAYASHTNVAGFDWSFGDLLITCRTWPTALTGTHTYYFQGDDANNYFTIYVDSTGAIGVVGVNSGTNVVNLRTAAGALATGSWQKLSVQQNQNNWWIRVNDVILATTNTPARLKNLTGTLYVGCGYDFGGSARNNYYAGNLCDLSFINQIYYRTQSFLDWCCEAGAIGSIYSHGESVAPREMYRVILDAIQQYSGPVTVMTLRGISQYIRTNGTVQADGFTYVRNTPLVSSNNYLPQANSPLVAAGAVVVPTGMTNVTDLAGLSITDESGNLIRATASVGAYEQPIPTPAPYIPPPNNVNIILQTNGVTLSVVFSVDLPDTCKSVGTWGQPVLLGNTVFVDAQFWSAPVGCLPVVMTVTNQYNLGSLPPGSYNFVFGAWGTTVKTQAFSVPGPHLSILLSGAQVELCWDTASNAWYHLQGSSVLTTNHWAPLTPWLPGNGSQFCTNDTVLASGAQRFYRVACTNGPPTP